MLQVAEDVRIVHKDTLQFRGDFIALRHDVVGRQMLAVGQRESFFQLGQFARRDDPGFIGQDIQSGFQGCQYAIDLAAISTSEHDDVARPFPKHLCDGILA